MWNQKKKKLNKNLNCSATSQHSGNIYRHLYVNISFSKRSTGKCRPARPSPHGHVFTSPVHQSDFNRGQNVVSWSNLKDHGGDSVELTLQHLTHTHTHKCNAASGLWELKPNINISQTIENHRSFSTRANTAENREQRTTEAFFVQQVNFMNDVRSQFSSETEVNWPVSATIMKYVFTMKLWNNITVLFKYHPEPMLMIFTNNKKRTN